jgi:hypothetical protein
MRSDIWRSSGSSAPRASIGTAISLQSSQTRGTGLCRRSPEAYHGLSPIRSPLCGPGSPRSIGASSPGADRAEPACRSSECPVTGRSQPRPLARAYPMHRCPAPAECLPLVWAGCRSSPAAMAGRAARRGWDLGVQLLDFRFPGVLGDSQSLFLSVRPSLRSEDQIVVSETTVEFCPLGRNTGEGLQDLPLSAAAGSTPCSGARDHRGSAGPAGRRAG